MSDQQGRKGVMPIRRALISVSDKTGLVELGQNLQSRRVDIISTGGTAKALKEAEVEVVEVSQLTGFPEMMGGRLKTLHPKVHGGLLYVRDNPEHRSAAEQNGIADIDLLVVNLYPFEQKVASGASYDECVENIDIGGPAMIRAAGKNHAFVAVVTDPGDYPRIIEQIDAYGGVTRELRNVLVKKAFHLTGSYDRAVESYFGAQYAIRGSV